LRHRFDSGSFDLPVLPAVLDQSGKRPDALGCLLEPPHALHYAAGDADLPADYPALYCLGLPGYARHGVDRDPQQESERLLGDDYVVLFVDTWRWTGVFLRYSERDVVRIPRGS